MITTKDKKVVIEHYTGTADTEAKLKAAGFIFTQEAFFNNFWGVRFTVEMPHGKGATARRNLLQALGEGR